MRQGSSKQEDGFKTSKRSLKMTSDNIDVIPRRRPFNQLLDLRAAAPHLSGIEVV
jgi:hypothetical protein